MDLWDKNEDTPNEIDYTLFEATMGNMCKEHGTLPSKAFRLPDTMSEIEAFNTDMRYSAAARWLEREQNKAGEILAERNRGDTPGKAKSPSLRKLAGGGADNYMKHKQERGQHGRHRNSN